LPAGSRRAQRSRIFLPREVLVVHRFEGTKVQLVNGAVEELFVGFGGRLAIASQGK
jgi:hypothetical protein